MNKNDRYKFIIFDLDGTLFSQRMSAFHDAPLDERTIRPNVRRKVKELQTDGIKIGVATNQEIGAFKGEFYGISTIQERIKHVAEFFDLDDNWLVEFGLPGSTYWKPNPAMLDDLIDMANTTLYSTLFVGDSDTDHQAAKAAGIDFAWAWDFFDWPNGEADRSIDWEEYEQAENSIWRMDERKA